MDRVVPLLFSPSVWFAQFLLVYSTESLICSRLGTPTAHQILVLVASAVALLAVMLRMRSDLADPARSPWAPMHCLAAIAVVWTALPVLILPSCSPHLSA